MNSNSPQPNPVLVNVMRRGKVESCHRGSAVVVDNEGKTVFSIGQADRMIYPRSSIKLLQAIPLVESGAADHFALDNREIALACASHSAESFHTETVTRWLTKLGLDPDALECGASRPLSEDAFRALAARGEVPSRVHQNCSGKHSGMLTLARFMGVETKGYSEYQHPTQAAWMKVFGELSGLDVFSLHWERDGCGLPAIYMPMDKLALAFSRYANIDQVGGDRGAAMTRILEAVRQHPEMVAGTGQCCTGVIKHSAGSAVVKTGAEGVYGGCVPDQGLGFALKVDDGATRGSEVMLGALLDKLDVIDSDMASQLAQWFEPEIKNSQGKVTGQVVPSTAWRSQAG